MMNNTMGAQTPEGQMHDAIQHAIDVAQPTPSSAEQELIGYFRQLPERDQNALVHQARQWMEALKAARPRTKRK